jgi:hypothetical protein
MASNNEPWFLEERAFAFVSLVLTKRSGVRVRAYAGRDMAIDLLIEILKEAKRVPRFFGAQLIAYLDLPKIENADERVLAHLGKDPFEATLPICAFLIGVRKPEALYRWVVQPVIEGGRALLSADAKPNWQALDEVEAGRLIDRVNDWYDALRAELTTKGSDRKAKADS